MNIRYEVISKNTDPILDLDEVKNYLRISHNYDDQLIVNLVQAAVEYAENFTGKMINETHVLCKISKANSLIVLQHFPIKDLLSVEFLEKGKTKDITNLYGAVSMVESKIKLNPSFRGKDILINYNCGYGKDLPMILKMTLMKHVCNMYEFNTDVTEVHNDINRSYASYRKLKI